MNLNYYQNLSFFIQIVDKYSQIHNLSYKSIHNDTIKSYLKNSLDKFYDIAKFDTSPPQTTKTFNDELHTFIYELYNEETYEDKLKRIQERETK